jgi:putative ABC transport system permease protein
MGLSLKISQIKEFLKETMKIIYYYKDRVAFSFSGVALGILSICIIITTIEGANKKAKEIFESMGPDSIMIFGGSERQRTARMRINTLTLKDAELLGQVEGIYELTKSYSVRNMVVRYGDKNWQTTVVGATPNYFESMSWRLEKGAPFTSIDDANLEAVCVIGSKVYDELFEGADPIGKAILTGRLHAKVIGILEERGGSGASHVDDRVIMPLNTVMTRIVNEKKYLRSIRLRTSRDPEETLEDVRAVLRASHGLADGVDDDFSIRSSKDILRFVTVISGSLLLFLGTAAMVALIVSGFVLANLFYLSIQERRRDIGIRRAYGATKRGILLSFLFESVVITIMGGIAGIILSIILGGTFERLFDIPMLFTYKVIVFALAFSLMTGLLSGLRPALFASRIEPIEAIRG